MVKKIKRSDSGREIEYIEETETEVYDEIPGNNEN